MVNIAVFVSGGGTNLQALIDAVEDGRIKNARIATVIASKDGIFALERAKKHNIPCCVMSSKNYKNQDDFDSSLIAHLKANEIGLIVLAGYLSILSDKVIAAFKNKIINVHPSLIPSFCGQGYYGLKVHEKALEYGVKITGATVHFVNEITDGGEIILQKAVEVLNDDTAQSLQRRVMEQAEWVLLQKAVQLFCDGKLQIIGRRVNIL